MAESGPTRNVAHLQEFYFLIDELVLLLLILEGEKPGRHVAETIWAVGLSISEKLFKQRAHGLHIGLLARLRGVIILIGLRSCQLD